jgi:hypothetical protein
VRPQQQFALSHIGGALLAAQIVEQLLDILLASPGKDSGGLEVLEFMPAAERKKALGRLLTILRSHGQLVPTLEDDLNTFLKERNKLAHYIPGLGTWNLQTDDGCRELVLFLRAFIDRSAQIQHHLVNALSARDVFLGPNSQAASKTFTEDMRRVYSLVSIRWADGIDAYNSLKADASGAA